MSYSDKQLERMYSLQEEYENRLSKICEEFLVLSSNMHGGIHEHTVYGICRRISTLKYCLGFFFSHLSPESKDVIPKESLTQGNVHLHAFLINCSGISDNIAWFLAYHHKLDETKDMEKFKFQVGLVGKKEFRTYITENLLVKLNEFESWFQHIKNFRDPTAHRIPPYLIPFIIYGEGGDIDYTPKYIHEFSKSTPVLLHALVLCDLGAIIELLEALLLDTRETYA
ncbi:hypothetical protein I7096_005141 [Vibrio parahaemolyticus]|nr:hypothetical protein [Vibrio parahaemolyticus]